MMVQTERKAGKLKYVRTVLAGFVILLFLQVNQVQAATDLALFNFQNANDMKVEKGAKLNLAGDQKAVSWKSSNPGVVKVSKKGIATAVKTGKAVISATIDGQKEKCKITVVGDVEKGSAFIKQAARTWKQEETGKKVTVKAGKLSKALDAFLSGIKRQNEDDVVYQGGSKIVAIEEDSAGATVYFEAKGVCGGKTMRFPCVAVITKDYENDAHDYAMLLHPVVWVTNEGQFLYGAGSFWYA